MCDIGFPVHVHVCADTEVNVGTFLSCSPPYSVSQGRFLHLDIAVWLDLLALELRHPASTFPALGF